MATKKKPTYFLENEFGGTDQYSADDIVRQVLDDEVLRLRDLAGRAVSRRELHNMIIRQTVIDRMEEMIPSDHDLSDISKMYAKVLTKRPKPVMEEDEEVAAAFMSDLHYGLATSDHPVERSKQAFRQYFSKVIRLTDLHRKAVPVKHIHLGFLGDLIQGLQNFPAQRWTVDMPAIDQTIGLVELGIWAIEVSLVEFDTVEVDWGDGNHEYMMPKKESTLPDKENWGRVAFEMIRQAFRNEPRVTFKHAKSWYQIVDINNIPVLMHHGHKIPGAGNETGIKNTVLKWQNVLPPFQYVFLGHFHRMGLISLPTHEMLGENERYIYMNGTAANRDPHLQPFGSSPTPQWWFMFFSQKRVTAEHRVDLYR